MQTYKYVKVLPLISQIVKIKNMVDFAFLDSGTGGIPYLERLLEIQPDVSCVYVGDTANFPYGEKTHEEIVKCVLEIAKKIIDRFSPKVFIVACNTMSVNALDVLREVFPSTDFVGTVPAIKLASSVSKKRRIGLLATESTVENPYNVDLKNHFASDCELVLRSDPELISFIEHESFTATKEECIKAIMPAINFFYEKDCDTIILGCTHFLNLAELFQETADNVSGRTIQIVDSREGVTNRALSIFNSLNQSSTGSDSKDATIDSKILHGQKKSRLYVTGLSKAKDRNEYDVICNRYHLEWGGII